MNAVLLMVSVGVEYPASPSTVGCGGVVGFILILKGQVFSLNSYKSAAAAFSGSLLDSRLLGLRSPIPNAEKPDEGAKTY